MLLTIDVGNTNIVLGGFCGDKLIFVARLSTDTRSTDSEYAIKIREILALNSASETVDGCIISSVVPPLTKKLKNAVKTIYGIDSLVVGPGIKTGVNRTDC